ncbi:MAG TPA: zinc-dependent metalloprotease [Phycisphaerae bacterium]|nr:zinc-dependent metalloprotease [Phycisphaerae bacterium]
MQMRQFLLILAVALWSMPALAQDPKQAGEENLDLSSIMASMAGNISVGETPDKDGLPKFEEVTKDMESKKGLFTLWYYPSGAKDKDPEKMLAQIPSGILGQKFMLSTSFSGGGFFTGFPLDERVVQWELEDKQLLLIEPETRFVVNKSKEVSDVVRRTYPDRIRVAVSLVTKSPGGDPVIDLGRLLKSDFADIGWMTRMGGLFGMGGGAGSINASLSKWVRKENFPATFKYNVELGVELAVSQFSPPGSYDKKQVHYSFWALPESDYQPRIADDRVGYFLTTNRDWAKPTDARDIFNRYVDRWHLVKRDASLPMCEPKQPITFYIEKTVPVRFRRAVRDGILEWNKAYEKIGFVNAVEVRQQTDDNEWKNLDPEDMRYSFFRWIVTGAGFAMGPHRANPFTGQIYDADIVFDDSMVRYFEQSAEQLLNAGAVAMKAGDPTLRNFLRQNPQWQRPSRDWERFVFGQQEDVKLRDAVRERARLRGHQFCEYCEGMKHEMAVAQSMLAGAPKEIIDKFLYDVIKEVVTHEVGHTLGLRHNFKASSVYTLEEIKQRRTKGEPTVGSVMDYNPVLFLKDQIPDDVPPGYFITPTIGPYDYWAIEYGYRPFDGNFKGTEKKGDQEQEGEAEVKKAEATETPVPPPAAMTGAMEVKLENIPQEVLDQLPPEVKQMIESGDIQKLMAQAGAAGGEAPPTAPGAPEGPSFSAAPSGEEGMLNAIASRCTEPELTYATDEDTTFLAPDPRVNRFDMAADPIVWAKARMDLANKRMDNILEWAVKDKESWYHLRSAFLTLAFEKARVLDYAGRYIGGQYFHRAHRGDADAPAPFVHVDAQTQREAMAFIEENAFGDDFFNVSPEVLNHLAPPRWWHEGMSVDYVMDFPVHNLIATFQWWTLFDRLFPNTLRRIHDAEMKTDGSDKFTVAEYIQRLQNACWSDATNVKRLGRQTWTDASPYVSDVRRSLQREYLGLVEPLVRQKPGEVISPDLHAMMQYALKKLANEIETVINAEKADFASQAHLVACKSRIDRMLAPKLDEYTPMMTFSMFGAETP